jgi:hypothetical protein
MTLWEVDESYRHTLILKWFIVCTLRRFVTCTLRKTSLDRRVKECDAGGISGRCFSRIVSKRAGNICHKEMSYEVVS